MKEQFLKEATTPLAKRIGNTVSSVWTIVFGNVDIYAEKKDFERQINLNAFKEELEDKISSIPEEKLTEPPLHILGPTLESSKYYFECKELRKMFSKLLTTSMNSDVTSTAHPSFVEIIKQITPDEAKIIRYLGPGVLEPLIHLNRSVPGSDSEANFYRNFSIIGEQSNCIFKEQVPSYIDNLQRLGLIIVPDGRHLIPIDEKYFPLENHISFLRLCDDLKKLDATPILQKRYFFLTDFGAQFYKACID